MRIAIVGAHGTGKTTLLNKLDGDKISEIARDVISEMGNPSLMSEDYLIKFECDVLYKQIYAELLLGSRGFISDRSVIDVLAYSGGMKQYDILKNIVSTHIKMLPYDIVFYTPIEFDIEDDGVRSCSVEFQHEIDTRLKILLEEFGIVPIMLTGSIEDRILKINKAINVYRNTPHNTNINGMMK